MESSSEGRCGEIASDFLIIVVTLIQLIFFAFFHQYIAWYTTEPNGSVTRLSVLTDDYFTWLSIVIIASILVIVTNIVMIFYNRDWFRQIAWIAFSIIGFVIVVSLLLIYPFDFSVIPNATAADVVPTVVTVFFVLMAIFYGTSALVMSVRLIRSYTGEREKE